MSGDDESIFQRCTCGCNLLEINYDADLGHYNFSVWSNHAGTRPLSFKDRLRWCIHVITTGKPWADHTVIDKPNAVRIADFIHKHNNRSN
jgi:hypothetical protein